MSISQFHNFLIEIRLIVNHLENYLNNPPILNNNSPRKRPELSLAEEQRKKEIHDAGSVGWYCRFLGHMINVTPAKILPRLGVFYFIILHGL